MAISGQAASFLSGGKIFIPVAQNRDSRRDHDHAGRKGIRRRAEVHAHRAGRQPHQPEAGVRSVGTVADRLAIHHRRRHHRHPARRSSTRRIDTTVQLSDGQSFVVAGLIKNNMNEALNKFPGLGEVPVMGALFRSTEFQTDQTELMFVVTPRLVKPLNTAVILPTDNHVVPGRSDVILMGSGEGKAPAPVRASAVDATPAAVPAQASASPVAPAPVALPAQAPASPVAPTPVALPAQAPAAPVTRRRSRRQRRLPHRRRVAPVARSTGTRSPVERRRSPRQRTLQPPSRPRRSPPRNRCAKPPSRPRPSRRSHRQPAHRTLNPDFSENTMNKSLALVLLALLGGCAASTTPNYDMRFGDAVREARQRMTLNPNAGSNRRPRRRHGWQVRARGHGPLPGLIQEATARGERDQHRRRHPAAASAERPWTPSRPTGCRQDEIRAGRKEREPHEIARPFISSTLFFATNFHR